MTDAKITETIWPRPPLFKFKYYFRRKKENCLSSKAYFIGETKLFIPVECHIGHRFICCSRDTPLYSKKELTKTS